MNASNISIEKVKENTRISHNRSAHDINANKRSAPNLSVLSRPSITKNKHPSVWKKLYDKNMLYQLENAFKFNENIDKVHFDEQGRWKKRDIKGLRKSK